MTTPPTAPVRNCPNLLLHPSATGVSSSSSSDSVGVVLGGTARRQQQQQHHHHHDSQSHQQHHHQQLHQRQRRRTASNGARYRTVLYSTNEIWPNQGIRRYISKVILLLSITLADNVILLHCHYIFASVMVLLLSNAQKVQIILFFCFTFFYHFY